MGRRRFEAIHVTSDEGVRGWPEALGAAGKKISARLPSRAASGSRWSFEMPGAWSALPVVVAVNVALPEPVGGGSEKCLP